MSRHRNNTFQTIHSPEIFFFGLQCYLIGLGDLDAIDKDLGSRVP